MPEERAMRNETDEEDYRIDQIEAREAARASRCQCGYPDWPGSCPGPANCPCCQTESDDE